MYLFININKNDHEYIQENNNKLNQLTFFLDKRVMMSHK